MNKTPFTFNDFDDFKKWIDNQSSQYEENNRKNTLLGTMVEPKVSSKKIAVKMEVEEGDANDLAVDFNENGGTIKDIDEKYYLIEVSCGSFYIQRHYVSKM